MAFWNRSKRNQNNLENSTEQSELFSVEGEGSNINQVEELNQAPDGSSEVDLDIPETREEIEQEVEVVAEKMLSETEQVKALIEEHFKDQFEKIREQSPDNSEEVIDQLKKDLLEKIQGKEAKTWFGKHLKSVASKFGLGAVTGMAVRSVVKNTAKIYLGSISLGSSIVLGAGIGGVAAAIETYRKDREKLVTSDVFRQLEDLENIDQPVDNLKMASIIDQARKELKKGKVFSKDTALLKVKLQKAETSLRLKLDKDKLEGKNDAQKFLEAMTASKGSRKELRKLEGIKNEKLENQIKLVMQANPTYSKQMAMNIAVGAAAGGFGGAAGYGMHALLDSEFVHGAVNWVTGGGSATSATAEHSAEIAKSASKNLNLNSSASDQFVNNIGSLEQEFANANNAETMEKLQSALLEQKFTIAAKKGEGLTNEARNLIHDYWLNKMQISGKSGQELTQDQLAKLIYAEDLLKDEFLNQSVGPEHIIQPGQNFELTGAQIENALNRADDLSPEKLANITKLLNSPGHHLSEKTIEQFNSDTLNNQANSFAGHVIENNKEIIDGSIKESISPKKSADLIRIQEEVTKASAEVEAAKEVAPKSSSTTMKIVATGAIGLLTAGALGYGAWKSLAYLNKKLGPKNKKESQLSDTEGEINEDITTFDSEIYDKYRKNFEIFQEDMKNRFGTEIILTDPSALYEVVDYMNDLEKIILSNPSFFEARTIYFNTKGENEANSLNEIDINVKDIPKNENLSWLSKIAHDSEVALEEGTESENTIIFSRKDGVKVELIEQAIQQRKEFFKENKIEIHGHEFNNKKLTIEDLEKAGLAPVYDIKIGDTEIKISKPYRIDKTRLAVTAYVKENDAFVARSYYTSGSSSMWRYLPGYREINGQLNWYDKAMSQEALTLPSEVQQVLADVSYDSNNILNVKDPNFLFAGTAKNLAKIEQGKEDRTVFFEVSKVGKVIPGLEHANTAYNEPKARPESLIISDKEFEPDFSVEPIAVWSQKSNVYTRRPDVEEGVVDVELYKSKNGEVNYIFCTDELDRTWIAAIESNGSVKSTGLRQSWIQASDMITPASEYFEESKGFGVQNILGVPYVDMYEKYNSKIPLIQKYRAVKNARKSNVQSNEMLDSAVEPTVVENEKVENEKVENESVENEKPENEKPENIKTLEEIRVEAREEKGLNPAQARAWSQLMRDKDGRIMNAVGEGKPLTEEDAKYIKSVLRSIDRYPNEPNKAPDKEKVAKLLPLYKMLKEKEAQFKGDDASLGHLESILSAIRKLNRQLYKKVEKKAKNI